METELLIRAGSFFVVFCSLATAEVFAPRRGLLTSKARRWSTNLTIVALNPLSLALVFPILPIGMALLTSEQNWGLFNLMGLPYWVKFFLGVVLLDLAVYTHHVLHHGLPVFWRLHMMHHADMDFDTTTGLRFHPAVVGPFVRHL